jgi:16S rRNA (guanine527-N7)-methyltransferase
VVEAARFGGCTLDDGQLEMLERYAGWLRSEGAAGGGIGPEESNRIEIRHLADSLLFASQFPHDVPEVLDVGSGVGLPGIPLAIALPRIRFCLVDRSGRRAGLMRRAIRILDLDNCEVVQGEIESLERQAPVLVSRASLPPDVMRGVALARITPGGVAVLAGSWKEPPQYPGWTTIEIPSYVLDQPVWLLIMRRE